MLSPSIGFFAFHHVFHDFHKMLLQIAIAFQNSKTYDPSGTAGQSCIQNDSNTYAKYSTITSDTGSQPIAKTHARPYSNSLIQKGAGDWKARQNGASVGVGVINQAALSPLND